METQAIRFGAVPGPGHYSVPDDPKVKNEFAAMFYREILKQSLTGSLAGVGEGVYGEMAKEVLIDNLARQLAEKNSSMLPELGRKGTGD